MVRRILFVLAAFVVCSCNRNRAISNKAPKTIEEQFLDKVDSMLPRFVNSKDFIIMHRYGSIEWTSNSTIICIPKSDIGKAELNLLYFMNNNDRVFPASGNTPIFLAFKLEIANPDSSIQYINLSHLPKMTFSEFRKFTFKRHMEEGLGEGFCSNYYVISDKTSNSIYLLDKTNPINETTTYLKTILRHISPMEYFQSLSLEHDCNKMEDLAIRLRELKDLDTFNFAMVHDKEGRYW